MRYKYVLLGVKDYIKDCWHDWLRRRVMAYGCKVMDCIIENGSNKWWTESYPWKEGNLWHYIYNRKIGAARKAFAKKYGYDLAEALGDFKLEDIEKMPEVEVVEIGAKRDV